METCASIEKDRLFARIATSPSHLNLLIFSKSLVILIWTEQVLGNSLKSTADETLFLELALRGYDLSKLRYDESTGEIIKIS